MISINFPTFIVALALGLFVTYITQPQDKIVYVYPTPDNVDKLLYKDLADTCYQFKSEEVDCDNKEGSLLNKILNIPVQK